MITLDTTNDYEAPPNRNHGDSIVMVDSDTDTGQLFNYKENIIFNNIWIRCQRDRRQWVVYFLVHKVAKPTNQKMLI